MYAQRAAQLLRDLKRNGGLPAYDSDGIAFAVGEIEALSEHTIQLVNALDEEEGALPPEVSATVVVNLNAARRNKRIVLAYLHERLQRLKRIRWEVGNVDEATMQNLSINEQKFFASYSELLANYQSAMSLDLTADLEMPPEDLDIEVRVLRDVGTVYMECGVVDLKKNTVHRLRRTEAEPLIRKGFLEHIVT